MEAKLLSNIFIIPILDRILLYAPLHNLASLLNLTSISLVKNGLISETNTGFEQLDGILNHLNTKTSPPPVPKTGDFVPKFLGLLPTRACNLTCKYCAFQSNGQGSQIMNPKLACQAIDWYIDLISRAEEERLEIHYFGGEPFCVEELIDLTLHYAKTRAEERGYTTYFEAATNGTFSQNRCYWVADNFDTIVLSLDGPPDVHDDHRRRKDGRGGVSDIIARNARILSEGPVKFCVRACITEATVERMEEFAAWFCQMFRPEVVCFEPLQPTPEATAAGLSPPDPWRFTTHFIRAADILEDYGVETMYATASIHTRQVTFCPVGSDAAIVSPDGTINACYLLEREWQSKGFDMRLGTMKQNGAPSHLVSDSLDYSVSLDRVAVESIRELNVLNKSACEQCFCRWHCAGGCHVNNQLPAKPGAYNRLCIQTRLITLYNILKAMGQQGLMEPLLSHPAGLEALMQPDGDALFRDEDNEHG